jgi:hypothetical protein
MTYPGIEDLSMDYGGKDANFSEVDATKAGRTGSP